MISPDIFPEVIITCIVFTGFSGILYASWKTKWFYITCAVFVLLYAILGADAFVVGPKGMGYMFSTQSGYFSPFEVVKAAFIAAWYIALGVCAGYMFTKMITNIYLRLVVGVVISLIYVAILNNFYWSSGPFISFNTCASTCSLLLVFVVIIAVGIYIFSYMGSKEAKGE